MGAVLATLHRLKLEDNTLVIVTSDNGGVLDDGYASHDAENAHGHRCNGALHGYKGSLWEGGHREPFLARWPGKIEAGTQSAELIGLVDMLATFSAIAGQSVPQGGGPDSFNVLPALLGGKSPREHLVVQANGTQRLALRKGPWKLIPTPGAAARGLLFHLADDLGETKNLAAMHPDVLNEMTALLERIRQNERSRP